MRRTIITLATIALVAMAAMVYFSAPASAAPIAETPATLYVASNGSDEPLCGAIDSPCRTVTRGVTRAQDAIAEGTVDVTVRIGAGTYDENVVIDAVADGHSLNLIGAGVSGTVIDGLGDTSVIAVDSGIVSVTGLSITGGQAPSGGGIHNTAGVLTISDAAVTGNTATGTDNTSASGGGGGIYNGTGTLTISDSAVSANSTAASGSLKGGGGIYNATGTLNILQSEVSNNASTGTGNAGGIFGLTGGVITISDSTVSNNTASSYVGGINNRGLLSITRSTVSDNTTQRNYGGGISNYGGTLVLTDSTMSGNSAMGANTGKGGAIYNRGPATVTNSTLVGNSATFGGGISNLGSGALTVTSSTLADNTATRDGGGFRWEGGIITFSNSIISASSCSANSAILDGGHNVSDICTFYVPSDTSISGSSTIGLAPLAANGSTGPQTMAIDSTSSAHHLVPGCSGTDARGMARPGFEGSTDCDAGAYELQGVAPTVTTQPQSQTLAISSDATFNATASGTPTPTVQWQVNTGTTWEDVSGATSTTLTVTDVTHAMSGTQYRAVFTNGVATSATTEAATLTVPVGALHHLVLSPTTGEMAAGESQEFTAEGFDSFNNSLGDVTDTTVFTGPTDITCTDATCTSMTPGSYTVTGTNGVATGSATLTVTAGVVPEVPLPTTNSIAEAEAELELATTGAGADVIQVGTIGFLLLVLGVFAVAKSVRRGTGEGAATAGVRVD